MLAVGGRAAIAASQNLVSIGQGSEHKFHCLRNWFGQQRSRLDLEFGTFLEVPKDVLQVHGGRL
jgi:hypothetical protein